MSDPTTAARMFGVLAIDGHGAGIALSVACVVGFTVAAWLLVRRTVLRLPVTAVTTGVPPHEGWRRHRARLLGASLIALGVVLLFLPGPGLPLILAGVLVCDLPGRATVLRWLLRRPTVLREVNRLRARHGVPPVSGG
jgi:hypothetical protein